MTAAIAAALALILLAGIRMAAGAEERWPVAFWAALPEPDHAVMTRIVQQYNKQNPYRPVVFTNYSSPTALLDALEKNHPPKLALIDSRWIGTLAPKLVPAETMLNSAGEMVRTMAQADTFPAVWKACELNGLAYAIPFSAETAALVLNESLLKRIPPVHTVQEWNKISDYLNADARKAFGIVLPLGWNEADLGEFWSDFSKTFAPPDNRDSDQKAEASALNVWWNWANRARTSPATPDSVPQNFGKGASWVLFPREVEALHGHFTVRLLPRFKRPWGHMKVTAIAFFDKENSWDFANYLTQYDQLKRWAMNTPTVPVNKQVYLSPDYLSQIDAQRHWMRIYIWAMVHAVPPYNFPNAPVVLKDIGKTLLRSLNKTLSETEAVKEIRLLLNSVSVSEVMSCA